MQHMTTKECADYLKVHINTLRKYVNEEGLPVLRFPGRRAWVFRKDLVDAWVYERSQPNVYVNGERVSEVKYDKSKSDSKIRVLVPNR